MGEIQYVAIKKYGSGLKDRRVVRNNNISTFDKKKVYDFQ